MVSEIQFAFSSNAFMRYPLAETIDILGKTGFKAIEIMADRPHAYPEDLSLKDISNIKCALKKWDMRVSNINAFMMNAIGDFHHPSWIEKDKNLREQRLRHTVRSLKLASELGVPSISTEPGGPLDGLEEKEATEIFLEGISKAGYVAAREGIFLLIEPEPGLLIETSRQMLNFFSLVEANPWIKLNCDLGHFFCVGEDPVQVIAKLGAWIKHFHLEDIPSNRDHKHLMLGTGAMDIPSILLAIKKFSYQGFVTVELYPYQDDPSLVAQKTFEYLQNISINNVE